MVSDIYEPTKKEKATSAAELQNKNSQKTQEDYKRLCQAKDSKDSQEPWQMAIQ